MSTPPRVRRAATRLDVARATLRRQDALLLDRRAPVPRPSTAEPPSAPAFVATGWPTGAFFQKAPLGVTLRVVGSNLVSLARRAVKELGWGSPRRAALNASQRLTASCRHRNDAEVPRGAPLAVGMRYGDLTVEEILGRRPGSSSTCTYALCSCRCDGVHGPGWRVVRSDNLRSGATTSCGCYWSYKDLRWRWRDYAPRATGKRGNYRTYVTKAGVGIVHRQSALLLMDWPKGSEYRKRGVEPRDVLVPFPPKAGAGAGG